MAANNFSLAKSVLQENNFLISQPKHMLWVLKRTVSMRLFFWAPKTYAKNYGKGNMGSLWFNGRILLYLLIRGF